MDTGTSHGKTRRYVYRRVLPWDVPVSIYNVAENFHAWWIMTTAMSVSEALMMMLLAFPTSYGFGVEADAGVCFGVVTTQYTPTVSCLALHHLQRRSVDIRKEGQHTHGVREWYVRMPPPSTHSIGMSATPFWIMVIWVPRWNRQGESVVVLWSCSYDHIYLFVPFPSLWLMAFRMCRRQCRHVCLTTKLLEWGL